MNTTDQRVVHFKPELNSETTAWVSIRTYHYVHQNAIGTWNMMVKWGWQPCRAPAR